MKKYTMLISMITFMLACGIFMAACDDDDDPMSYRVTLVNLTANQPFSPVAVMLHGERFSPWRFGEAVSAGLETLAESGSPDGLIAEANASPDMMDTTAGTSPIGMGASGNFEVTAEEGDRAYLTVASMLVNTNDAFAGINAVKIDGLAVDEHITLFANALDAGTEVNTEAMADIPGPAAGGQGFNAARDDQNIVAIHPGVVTADDGLMASVLNESHRWDNPVARITVTRID
jgi:hypothetical protein